MSMIKKGGLGKGLGGKSLGKPSKGQGLSALIPDGKALSPLEVDLRLLKPDAQQPRRYFDQEKLDGLSESIKAHGIIQPIVVLPLKGGQYQIIAGERRWRAAQMAGLKKVPILCKDVDDLARMEIALLENIQRQDLTPIEEALAFERLIKEFKLSHEVVAQKTGKSRSNISNTLRLLNLPKHIQELIDHEKLSSGHGRALLGIADQADQERLLSLIQTQELSVRAAEQWVQNYKAKNSTKNGSKTKVPAHYQNLSTQLSHELNRTVQVKQSKKGGKVVLSFSDEQDLEQLLSLLGQS